MKSWKLEHTAHQSLNSLHDFVGGEGIEPGGGLVKKEDARVADQRDADVGSLGLAPADAPRQHVANVRVCTPLQRKKINMHVLSLQPND